MSFKLVNVLITFQRFVNQILQKELNKETMIYINDIFIIKKIKKEHRERTRRILKKLLTTELRIKFFKNEFEKKEVKFLGYIIEQEDIKSDPEKIKILKEWSRSTKVKEIQSLIGFVNYYRKLVFKLSKTVYSLN